MHPLNICCIWCKVSGPGLSESSVAPSPAPMVIDIVGPGTDTSPGPHNWVTLITIYISAWTSDQRVHNSNLIRIIVIYVLFFLYPSSFLHKCHYNIQIDNMGKNAYSYIFNHYSKYGLPELFKTKLSIFHYLEFQEALPLLLWLNNMYLMWWLHHGTSRL